MSYDPPVMGCGQDSNPPVLILPTLYNDPNLSLCTPSSLTNSLYLCTYGQQCCNEGNGPDSRCRDHSNGVNLVECH